jgi:signal transduction histidine kinase
VKSYFSIAHIKRLISSKFLKTRTKAKNWSETKWYYTYYLLAIFNILTIYTSLYLNHKLGKTYTESVELNRVWATRLQEYSKLGELAIAVKSPGDDVFESRDPLNESERLKNALPQYLKQRNKVRQELITNVDRQQITLLMESLDEMEKAMLTMLREINLIYFDFKQNIDDFDQISERRITAMNRQYSNFQSELAKLRQQVSEIQVAAFQQQQIEGEELKLYEYTIAVFVLIIIAGTTFYGHKLARQMELNLRERSRSLHKLEQAEIELEKRNQKLTETIEQLQKTQQELIYSEKMVALGQLVAGIAHEINTPLGAIQAAAGNTTKALEESLSELPEFTQRLNPQQQADFFKLLDKALQSKNSIVTSSEKRPIKKALTSQLEKHGIENARSVANLAIDIGIYENIDLLLPLLKHADFAWIMQLAYNLTRLQSNSRTIVTAVDKAAKIVFALKNYARYDPTEQKQLALVEDGINTVLELYHNQIKQGIELVRDYHSSLPPIQCYPDELIQVWTNLIHNAIQAMSGKGFLRITIDRANDYLKVQIADSGDGIPREIQDKIFQPFFTTKPLGEGSGLGLDIVKKIVEKHQGKIEFTTEPGKTIFTVLLPIN